MNLIISISPCFPKSSTDKGQSNVRGERDIGISENSDYPKIVENKFRVMEGGGRYLLYGNYCIQGA